MSQPNTLKTIFGYCKSLLHRRFPMNVGNSSIVDIYNHLPIDDCLSTSGQPSAAQFELIAAEGFKKVVNLAPYDAENALADEATILAKLGVEYFHIPVDFKNPTDSDFQQFCTLLDSIVNHKVWVHCAANMRVSAFTYRYRRDVLGVDEESARADLHKIWQPFGVWRKFIDCVAE